MAGRNKTPDTRDWVETLTFWIVGIGLGVIPLLVFFFSFGNVGSFGESLGIEHRIAYLTGPAVDLAVLVLVIAASYLSMRGRTEGDLWPLHLAALVCGAIMILLNTAGAIHIRHWRLAAVDCVGPVLLIGWGVLAPWLWRNLTEARRRSAPGTAAPGNPAVPRQRTAPAAQPMPPPSGTESAISAAAARPHTPAPEHADAAPVRQAAGPGPGSAGNVVDFAASGRRSPAQWAELALPLWRRHVETTGSTPTAKELAAALRHAHPTLAVPASDRSERNIRAATEELADSPEDAPDREAAG